jgi:hypothetical protein
MTPVPFTATLKPEASGVLMTLGAICHHLGASSAEVTLGAIRSAESSLSDLASPRPRLGRSPAM